MTATAKTDQTFCHDVLFNDNSQRQTYRISQNILGPIGPGPSSSHSIAPYLAVQELVKKLGEFPKEANITAYNSFATTGDGHGTFIAITAALLCIPARDPNLYNASKIAATFGLKVEIQRLIDQKYDDCQLDIRISGSTRTISAVLLSKGGGTYKIRNCSIEQDQAKVV